MLAEQGGGDISQTEAGALGDLFERQILAGLGVEDFRGQLEAGVVVSVGLLHGGSPVAVGMCLGVTPSSADQQIASKTDMQCNA
ncbi:hypothetical protein D3C81_1890900 [compost metagenome]